MPLAQIVQGVGQRRLAQLRHASGGIVVPGGEAGMTAIGVRKHRKRDGLRGRVFSTKLISAIGQVIISTMSLKAELSDAAMVGRPSTQAKPRETRRRTTSRE